MFTVVDVPEGIHQYKFNVDGEWLYEPSEVCFLSFVLNKFYAGFCILYLSLFCSHEWPSFCLDIVTIMKFSAFILRHLDDSMSNLIASIFVFEKIT
jgi:hypothetical protein